MSAASSMKSGEVTLSFMVIVLGCTANWMDVVLNNYSSGILSRINPRSEMDARDSRRKYDENASLARAWYACLQIVCRRTARGDPFLLSLRSRSGCASTFSTLT
jgi:hypothetical protein